MFIFFFKIYKLMRHTVDRYVNVFLLEYCVLVEFIDYTF